MFCFFALSCLSVFTCLFDRTSFFCVCSDYRPENEFSNVEPRDPQGPHQRGVDRDGGSGERFSSIYAGFADTNYARGGGGL